MKNKNFKQFFFVVQPASEQNVRRVTVDPHNSLGASMFGMGQDLTHADMAVSALYLHSLHQRQVKGDSTSSLDRKSNLDQEKEKKKVFFSSMLNQPILKLMKIRNARGLICIPIDKSHLRFFSPAAQLLASKANFILQSRRRGYVTGESSIWQGPSPNMGNISEQPDGEKLPLLRKQ